MMFGCFYDMKVLFIQSSAFMLAQLVVCPAWQREYSKIERVVGGVQVL